MGFYPFRRSFCYALSHISKQSLPVPAIGARLDDTTAPCRTTSSVRHSHRPPPDQNRPLPRLRRETWGQVLPFAYSRYLRLRIGLADEEQTRPAAGQVSPASWQCWMMIIHGLPFGPKRCGLLVFCSDSHSAMPSQESTSVLCRVRQRAPCSVTPFLRVPPL